MQPQPHRDLLRRAVKVGIGLIVVLDVVDAIRAANRRSSRAFHGWLAGREREEQRRLHGAEVAVLARALRSR